MPDTVLAHLPAVQTHSGKLQAVLDIVLSHQGAALKSELMQRLMSALVLPAPEHYRALLRRLAALSGGRRLPACLLALAFSQLIALLPSLPLWRCIRTQRAPVFNLGLDHR